MPVAAIVDADRATFYGSAMARFYAQSWLLVHFLQHGEEGWAHDAFPRMLLYAAEGYPVRDVLPAVYGLEAAELEPGYRESVRQF